MSFGSVSVRLNARKEARPSVDVFPVAPDSFSVDSAELNIVEPCQGDFFI